MSNDDIDTNARMEELSKFENLRNPEMLEKLHVTVHKRMEYLSKKLFYPTKCDHKAHGAFSRCPYTSLQRWRYEQENRESNEEEK